ncbi:MAG: ParA family protein [Chloroflexota bacterium]
MPIIAIANPTPGSGKTTTAVALAAFWGAFGARTLVTDLSPNADATTALRNAITINLGQVLSQNMPAERAVARSRIQRVDIMHGTTDLSHHEAGGPSAEQQLRAVVGETSGRYGYTLVDLPSSSGPLTRAGLAVADALLVPLACDDRTAQDISASLRQLGRLRAELNPHLHVQLLPTMAAGSRGRHVVSELRRVYPDLTTKTIIPPDEELGAVLEGKSPLNLVGRGARAYEALSVELAHRAVAFSRPQAV